MGHGPELTAGSQALFAPAQPGQAPLDLHSSAPPEHFRRRSYTDARWATLIAPDSHRAGRHAPGPHGRTTGH